MTQMGFARAAGIPITTLKNWLVASKPPIRPDNMVRLSQALKLRPEDLMLKLLGCVDDDVDENVDPYSEVKLLAPIPVFDLAVAAGKWVDVSEIGEIRDPGMIAQGLFRVRVRGDSMKPAYMDGSMVEFHCLRAGGDEDVEVGRDYYVQRADGTATFKRVAAIEDGIIRLEAVNRRKYKTPLTVARTEIVRIARAVARVELVE